MVMVRMLGSWIFFIFFNPSKFLEPRWNLYKFVDYTSMSIRQVYITNNG